ncbi:ATP-binding cassette domain-containing protein (plasmid) [Klebsiella sp. KPN54798]|nr:ATP-binding cassette domain-containing protein [Klebsiella sp. KPN54798]
MKRNTVSNLTEKDDFDTLESILSVNIHSLLRPDGGTLLSDVHFAVKAGECLAIIGPNGSGKTSLVRAISQELTHLKGTFFCGAVLCLLYPVNSEPGWLLFWPRMIHLIRDYPLRIM